MRRFLSLRVTAGLRHLCHLRRDAWAWSLGLCPCRSLSCGSRGPHLRVASCSWPGQSVVKAYPARISPPLDLALPHPTTALAPHAQPHGIFNHRQLRRPGRQRESSSAGRPICSIFFWLNVSCAGFIGRAPQLFQWPVRVHTRGFSQRVLFLCPLLCRRRRRRRRYLEDVTALSDAGRAGAGPVVILLVT